MKYIKTYEDNLDIAYSIDDTVVCINKLYLDDLIDKKYDVNKNYPVIGEKYKVYQIYGGYPYYNKYSNVNYKNLNNIYVNVIDNNNKMYVGIRAKLFMSELDFKAKKYNL